MASTSHDPTPSSTPWDVFLSFRGSDTRYTFTRNLYDALDRIGIRTFMDDRELHGGEVISDALPQAIKDSKTYIVVFSENYASSRWCLDELVEILACYKTILGRLVIPVFYKIDPLVVRHQIGSFGRAFEKHQSRFDGEKLEKWSLTLEEVAGFSGKEVSPRRYEADIIEEIVHEISLKIEPNTLYVAEHPVGLDARVNNITKLLSSRTEGVTKIGLYGMGGVGKSTLAKAVYNKLLSEGTFKGSCLEVGEASRRANGLVSLQQQLLDDVLRSKEKVEVHNVGEGIMFITKRICLAKVLVLIDDIVDHEQYKYLVGPFASGSVVIVTTRNEVILDKIEVEAKYRCQVQVLDKAESLILFTQHAFGNAKPDNTLTVLFEEILSLAGGLPLALVVFGAYLYKMPVVGWKSYIEKLKRNPDSTIQEKLVISFNALKSDDPMLGKIFLDIACFFIGREKQEVVDILATYCSYVDHKIDILKKRCLLTIDNRETLRMHDLLRDMGREVVRNNSPDEPGKHSRLWESKDICYVLKKHKGTEAIEGIIPSNFSYQNAFEGVSFATATFKRMPNLRFLHIENVDLSGSFEDIFENLRWLRWDSCPLECLPSDFCPEELVILALRRSEIRTMWKLNMDSQVFRKLKTLDMSYSLDLTITPDFTKLPCLETLKLKGCKSLEGLHESIGLLVSLSYLNLSSCINLRSLPENICNLRALKRLDIGGCSSLEALPIKLGNIESLTELNAWGLTTVSNIPDSIIHLSNLRELNLSDFEYGNSRDVFLSFGSDTRFTFTDDLCLALSRSGVMTFMDEPRSGKEMTNALIRDIRNSKIHIVVFSERYAFSSRCLDQLVVILKSHKTMKRPIIVVYYNIDPSVVRHQMESFEAAFKAIEIIYGAEKVNEWRRTLTEVAGFSGFHIISNRSDEADIVSKVVDTVLYGARYPVGLDCRVRDIRRLLSSLYGMGGVGKSTIKIGLYGMGGVGKSTLARALYNHLLFTSLNSFKGSCFLANVREVSRTTKGLVSLQQQLINDVLGTDKVKVHNVEQGTKIIQSILCLTKILIVDDLDDHKQFESLVGSFASGSVVIVTTRYEEILDKIGVQPKYRYMVNVLDDAESLELFTRHAFGDYRPDKTLLELSKVILHHAGGLPSALVASASHLYNQSEVAWKDYIQNQIFSKDSKESDEQKDSIEAVESDEQHFKKKKKKSDEENDSIESDDQKDSIESIESDDLVQKKIFLENACCFM